MATFAVTGASGFIGRTVVAHASARGHRVLPLSRADASLPGGYEDVDALTRAFAGVDAVIHLAARAHRGGTDADFDGNVRSTTAVARAARASGVARVVLASSIGVNGNLTGTRAFTEADPPAPAEAYARSKLRAEQALRDTLSGGGTRWVIVRPPLVYGPDAPGNFGRLVRAVARGWPLPLGAVRNQRSMVGVDHLAAALLACALHPSAADQLFLVADGADLSTPDIVRCIARGLRRDAKVFDAPVGLLRVAARLTGRTRVAQSLFDSLQVDASKIRTLLGWAPSVGSAQGIERAAAAWSIA